MGSLEALKDIIRHQKTCRVTLGVVLKSTQHAHLSVIRVDDEFQNQGLGTKAMLSLCDWADRHKIILDLTCDPMFGMTDPSRLKTFYKRRGFRGDGVMVRLPKNNSRRRVDKVSLE